MTDAKVALEQVEAERATLRAEVEHLHRMRSRNMERLNGLRLSLESVRQSLDSVSTESALLSAEIEFAEQKFEKRYQAAFDDPGTGLKARLKWRIANAMGPLGRRMRRRLTRADLVRRSLYFDREWYLHQNPDVTASGVDPAQHFATFGGAEGRDPGPLFSTTRYLENNPDVIVFGNPLLHYLIHGKDEGRRVESPFQQVKIERAKPNPVEMANFSHFSMLYVSGEPLSPGHIYRVSRFMDAAKANNTEAQWIRQDELPLRLDDISNYNVIVLWRTPWDDGIAKAIEIVRANGGTVVFDVDDLMVAPELAQTGIIDGIRSQALTEDGTRGHFERIRQSMVASDICFATTEELAFHMRSARKAVCVLPNGFDQEVHDVSRQTARNYRKQRDGLIRIGYAGGSRTHQRDFAVASEAVARVLRETPQCRLVIFRSAVDDLGLVDIAEFACFDNLRDQIEWRHLVPLLDLPRELARFDINIAPLEFGNPFCEAKSELKFFEAALVDVPTVASPTGPFRRAIEHGKTGYLAATADDWYSHIMMLVNDQGLRADIGHNAYHMALAMYGPRQRTLQFGRVIDQLQGGSLAARGFALDMHLRPQRPGASKVYPSDVLFEHDKGCFAELSVIIPLYNYETYVTEALESVLQQTLATLDLVIVDGYSTDRSLQVAMDWARSHAERFNRVVVLQNQTNYGLGFCRNSGFDAADTPYVLPLDADNRLLPDCCAHLLTHIKQAGTAYVYPSIRHFGSSSALISSAPYAPQQFVAGNYIDAMAIIAKEAWAIVGGYEHVRYGWEDYDFWCRIAAVGMAGDWHSEVLAEYRVHEKSMMQTQTLFAGNYQKLLQGFTQRHPWTWLQDQHAARKVPHLAEHLTDPDAITRLDRLLHILRCPVTGQKLGYNEAKTELRSYDGLQSWPIIAGRPVLSPLLLNPEVRAPDHISNELPDEALSIIRETKGLVLNLSAGGSREKFDHVVEVEYAVFRHTDIVADAHVLPFDDCCFDAAIVMNAFEHFREPLKVAAELLRVLKPEGIIHIRTAFLQPLHERPWHFYPCTRHGLEEWFKNFETKTLHVSENFCPNHSIAWIASELETALRDDVSPESGDRFRGATVGQLIDLWRDPAQRNTPLWTDFFGISQPTQEITAAGFELIGRKPVDKPELG